MMEAITNWLKCNDKEAALSTITQLTDCVNVERLGEWELKQVLRVCVIHSQ